MKRNQQNVCTCVVVVEVGCVHVEVGCVHVCVCALCICTRHCEDRICKCKAMVKEKAIWDDWRM